MKITLFNFILIPHLILASSLTTGDAYSKSSMQINTDGENGIIQNNTAVEVSNSGNKINGEAGYNIVPGEEKILRVASSEPKTEQNSPKPVIISSLEKFLNFILGLFKK